MKIIKFILAIVAAVALVAADFGNQSLAGDFVNEFRKEREQNQQPRFDVTHLVQGRIPVGTSAESAKEILEKNGFKITRVDLAGGKYQLMGSRLERTNPSFLPFLKDEYRIGLTIEGDRVVSVFARIILQSL